MWCELGFLDGLHESPLYIVADPGLVVMTVDLTSHGTTLPTMLYL